MVVVEVLCCVLCRMDVVGVQTLLLSNDRIT